MFSYQRMCSFTTVRAQRVLPPAQQKAACVCVWAVYYIQKAACGEGGSFLVKTCPTSRRNEHEVRRNTPGAEEPMWLWFGPPMGLLRAATVCAETKNGCATPRVLGTLGEASEVETPEARASEGVGRRRERE